MQSIDEGSVECGAAAHAGASLFCVRACWGVEATRADCASYEWFVTSRGTAVLSRLLR
jgi:hypothetical protein